MTERYTREEWEQIQRKEACERQGHDFQVLMAGGSIAPTNLLCLRCGQSWKVQS